MDTRSDRPDGGTEVILFPSKEVKNDRLLVFPSPGFTEAPKSPIAVLGDESGQTRIVSARLENSPADRTAIAVSSGLFAELKARDHHVSEGNALATDESLKAWVWSAHVLDVIIHGEVGWLAIWAALLAQLAAVGAAVVTFLTTTLAVGVACTVLAVAILSATLGAYKDIRAAFRNRA